MDRDSLRHDLMGSLSPGAPRFSSISTGHSCCKRRGYLFRSGSNPVPNAGSRASKLPTQQHPPGTEQKLLMAIILTISLNSSGKPETFVEAFAPWIIERHYAPPTLTFKDSASSWFVSQRWTFALLLYSTELQGTCVDWGILNNIWKTPCPMQLPAVSQDGNV